MVAFASWLIGFSKSFIVWLCNNGIDFLQAAFDGFCLFVAGLVTLLPPGSSAPAALTTPSDSAFAAVINALNWVFPMGFFIQCVAWGCAGMVLYLGIAPLMRWAKLLQ